MQAKREKAPGRTQRHPGARRRGPADRVPVGRRSRAGRKRRRPSFSGLRMLRLRVARRQADLKKLESRDSSFGSPFNITGKVEARIPMTRQNSGKRRRRPTNPHSERRKLLTRLLEIG